MCLCCISPSAGLVFDASHRPGLCRCLSKAPWRLGLAPELVVAPRPVLSMKLAAPAGGTNKRRRQSQGSTDTDGGDSLRAEVEKLKKLSLAHDREIRELKAFSESVMRLPATSPIGLKCEEFLEAWNAAKPSGGQNRERGAHPYGPPRWGLFTRILEQMVPLVDALTMEQKGLLSDYFPSGLKAVVANMAGADEETAVTILKGMARVVEYVQLIKVKPGKRHKDGCFVLKVRHATASSCVGVPWMGTELENECPETLLKDMKVVFECHDMLERGPGPEGPLARALRQK